MKLTELQIEALETIKTTFEATPENLAGSLKITAKRAEKILETLDDAGLLPNHFGLNETEQEIILLALQTPAPPAQYRFVARSPKAFCLAGLRDFTGPNKRLPVYGNPESIEMVANITNAIFGKADVDGLIDDYSKYLSHFDLMTSIEVSRQDGPDIHLVSLPNPSAEVGKEWLSYGLNPIKCCFVQKPHLNVPYFVKHVKIPAAAQGIMIFRKIAEDLENRGLAVRTVGIIGAEGIVLTDAGMILAQEVKTWIEEVPTRELIAKHVPQKIHCPSCGQSLLQTNFRYVDAGPVVGNMFSPFGKAAVESWSLPFGDVDGDIVCPECGSSLQNENGEIVPQLLHKI
jgi:hypothetical protein